MLFRRCNNVVDVYTTLLQRCWRLYKLYQHQSDVACAYWEMRVLNFLSTFFYLRWTYQNSAAQNLVKGQRYYAELLLREKDADDHVEVMFQHPDSGIWCAMSRKYLEKSRWFAGVSTNRLRDAVKFLEARVDRRYYNNPLMFDISNFWLFSNFSFSCLTP